MSITCGPIVPVRIGNVTDGEPSENWIVAVESVIGTSFGSWFERAVSRPLIILLLAIASSPRLSMGLPRIMPRAAERRTARAADRKHRRGRSEDPTTRHLSYGEAHRDLQRPLRSAYRHWRRGNARGSGRF